MTAPRLTTAEMREYAQAYAADYPPGVIIAIPPLAGWEVIACGDLVCAVHVTADEQATLAFLCDMVAVRWGRHNHPSAGA